ncbi:MAG: hypothetical protein AAGD09_22535 [Cyanobacteria bacterium P01_F01_bin.56]
MPVISKSWIQAKKSEDYQQLVAPEEHVLISQDLQQVEFHRRTAISYCNTLTDRQRDRVKLQSNDLEVAFMQYARSAIADLDPGLDG